MINSFFSRKKQNIPSVQEAYSIFFFVTLLLSNILYNCIIRIYFHQPNAVHVYAFICPLPPPLIRYKTDWQSD